MLRISFRAFVGVGLAAALLVAGFVTASATGHVSGQASSGNSQHLLAMYPGYPTQHYPDEEPIGR